MVRSVEIFDPRRKQTGRRGAVQGEDQIGFPENPFAQNVRQNLARRTGGWPGKTRLRSASSSGVRRCRASNARGLATGMTSREPSRMVGSV